jgi:hypothetical protein
VSKEIDKIRRAFLWKGTDAVAGGKRLVNWQAVCHPKPFGGLGILNLDIMNTAFSVCRAWKLRAEEEKTLVLTSLSC